MPSPPRERTPRRAGHSVPEHPSLRVRSAALAHTAAGREGLPRDGLPEVAFLGRSNVGKSSLLNRLVGRRNLARTSGTPGKTRLLHFYRVELETRALYLVDLPGYGYARVARSERRRWRERVEGYLGARPPLRCAVLLQDLRRDVSADELDLIAWLDARGVPVLVALTKCDKRRPMQRAARVRELRRALGLPCARVIATSATAPLGIDALWSAIVAEIGAADGAAGAGAPPPEPSVCPEGP